MNDRKVWINGELRPESEAVVSVYDSAMMFGDTVFEMTRSFNGKQFKLKEHINRLFNSAKHLRIPIPLTPEELETACLLTQMANPFDFEDEHRLMINVTRGVLPMYSETGNPGTNVIITDFPLRWTVAGMGKLFDDGINAVTPSQRAIPASLLEPKVKNRSRIHYLMANIQTAQMKGSNNWAVMLDPDGHIAEGPGWNFFIVCGGQLETPRTTNILNGISRQYVMDMATAYSTNLNEHDIIARAEEAFITATPFCMLPVTSFNGVPIGDGKVGPTYKRILENWGTNVGVDIKAQIKSWDSGAKEGASAYGFK